MTTDRDGLPQGDKFWLTGCWAFAFLLAVCVQAFALITIWPMLLDGQLAGTDSYTWLGHVERLMATGGWFDHLQPRANWPEGEIQHSSRPFDALLLGGTWLLGPWLGSAQALFWAGAMVGPTLYLILCIAMAWVMSASFGVWRGPLAVLFLLPQFSVLSYALPARSDHHPLLMIGFVAVLGLSLRMLADRRSHAKAFLAGCTAGLSIWLSPELLLPLAVVFLSLGWVWLRSGPEEAVTGRWHSLGLLAGVAFAILAEYGRSGFLLTRTDGVSAAHMVMACVALGFWIFVDFYERWRGSLSSAKRATIGLLAAGIAIASFHLLFPDFFAGPASDMDERARIVLLDDVMEMGGLWPADSGGWGRLLLYLGFPLLSFPVAIALLVFGRSSSLIGARALLLLLLSVYLAASLTALRFSPYASLLAALILADGAAAFLAGPQLAWRVRAAVGVLGCALVLAVSGLVTNLAARSLLQLPPCHQRLNEFSVFLEERGAVDGPFVIAAMADLGPELLYRTRHRVIATPSLSNQAGAIDLFTLFSAGDERTARRVIERRGIDHVLVCKAVPAEAASKEDRRLYQRLSRGEIPGWLQAVSLPAEHNATWALYRVKQLPRINR